MVLGTIRLLLLVLISSLFFTTSAVAQLIPDWEAKQFTLERIDADRVRLVREVEIIGTGPNAGQQIFADSVEWNITTGEFVAIGNVVLASPTSRLAAERVVFNTKTQRGTFESAFGIAQLGAQGQKDRSMFGTLEPDVYFYGKTIDKIGQDKYRIHDGWFTTCVQPTPRWEIVTGDATIDLGDYAILKNAVMRVKDVPVFYLPVLYYPIKDDDRATGFLLPTYGNSTYRGQSLSNAFFWAINRSQDATFMHDWFAKRGQGMGTEYRYVSGPGADGFFRAYWLNESEALLSQSGGGTFVEPARRSYELRGRLVQPLPKRLTARGNIDYFSSLKTQQLYNTDIYNATRSTRSYNGTVTGAYGHVNLTGTYSRNETFISQLQSITQGMEPGVVVNFSSTRIRELPLYFAMNSDASRTVYRSQITDTAGHKAVEDLGLGRIDMYPILRAPLTKWPFLNLNTQLGVRTTYFSESLSVANDQSSRVPVGLWRHYEEVRADVTGPIFSRVFSPQNAFAERLKHLIEPGFSVTRVSRIENQSKVPQTGSSYDVVVGGVTRLQYGLTNRLLVRKAQQEAAGVPANPAAAAPREFLNVTLAQSYYTDENASRYDQMSIQFGQRPPSHFSPVTLSVRSTPTLGSTATLQAEYDATKGQLEAVSTSGGVNYPNLQLRAGLSNRPALRDRSGNILTRTNSLDFDSSFSIDSGRIGGTYRMNWDISRGEILNQRWVGSYNAQCCGLMVEYQTFAVGLGSLLPNDRRFNLSFTLAGIGSFSNFFGTFGGGIGGVR